ncbi:MULTISPECIES: methyltransferase domain-containing protein [Halomonadaceae]|uniref:methyltransferase domain-containing protein n=1 Tax=Halomonadaceae TaxID=28256 RepID=UPI001597BFF5|nr:MULTISPECIES: methyltransferase domain-containing protein [Halomonas]QJQ94545.1 methyltransferase domain-containing protein [Halomonas sp. PA5]
MITSLARRRLEGELMDDPDIDDRAHQRALHGLRRINNVSRTAAALWPSIARIAKTRQSRTLSLLDVATGGGDVAISLVRRARRAGLDLQVEGCDISPTALDFAAQAAQRAKVPVTFFELDVLTEPVPRHYDIVTSTLFLHHLDDEQVVALLGQLADCADHLLISDLIRNRAGYGLAYLGTRLLSASRVVHVDGMRSVRAALTLPEARTLAAQAGLDGVTFTRHWPSRFLLHWARPPGMHR